MKQISLTQGKYTLVDNEDYEYLNQWKWHSQRDKNTVSKSMEMALPKR